MNGEVGHLECLGPVDEVGQVEVVDVVSGEDVGVALPDEGRPLGQQVLLLGAGDHLEVRKVRKAKDCQEGQ